ncbi:MAG: aminotransferase class I/II-fold pyridoxal phosphate-dependent enzyme [Gammaproteobacteria bacterium]|jgi:histidinol-phosphate aminotransferase|nr:aminotransferase class I/II-fold pyridoxal phosphate-dependent enzyme [Gammaproteobacteria bacterium]MBU0788823.1 aminotransferase class I/II-fold pyridoxal phosphate-dependent enzyme [Gammaproteobacteria bacterium]MBU0814557.1 aminotransferase class I/II-fold pyridoxal phosphate-dependent enzyme [Gammaproteobacteria bacterium]MBU1786600.1 aminotransferase class I/II-fold pyridoxal phosphate-dependent enzyme [Gammaproteobacteria bacterium]
MTAPPFQRVHGGPDSEGVPLYDFSTNSNACGPCPGALSVVEQAEASRYPDASYTVLRAQLATWHGVAPQRVLLAGSASEFIFRITAWVSQQGGKEVWLPPHSYGDYAEAAQACGLVQTPQRHSAQLLWCCDPSSPLGAPQADLGELAASGQVCVLDRAYEPLRLSGALALSEEGLQQVWQLWSPNKALGMTGVRAAYVIAPLGADDAVAALERLCPSWPIGAHGVALLEAWVQPAVQDWLAQSRVTLREWKSRQLAMCESLGWRCLPSTANFFCVHPGIQGESLLRALGQLRAQGIKLRDTSSFGLPGHLRLSVLPPFAQEALRVAWLGLRNTEQGIEEALA